MHRTFSLKESIVSLHRLLGPVDDYAGDGLEYNISTCIPERLANPPPPHVTLPAINQPFIVLTETKFSYRYIPVWARYSPHL